jgi:phage gp36-like protein
MIRFLRIKDYYAAIKQDNLNVIIEDAGGTPDERFLIEVEGAALTEIQSYLRHRYDVATIFTPIDKWVASTPYLTDAIVYFEDDNLTYKALTAHTSATNPDADPTNWVEISDTRDQQLKLYLIDVTLYHTHSRINPRNIPDLRLLRRDEAIKWLTMISKGDITVNLPEIDAENKQGYSITYGGETKRTNSY